MQDNETLLKITKVTITNASGGILLSAAAEAFVPDPRTTYVVFSPVATGIYFTDSAQTCDTTNGVPIGAPPGRPLRVNAAKLKTLKFIASSATIVMNIEEYGPPVVQA